MPWPALQRMPDELIPKGLQWSMDGSYVHFLGELEGLNASDPPTAATSTAWPRSFVHVRLA